MKRYISMMLVIIILLSGVTVQASNSITSNTYSKTSTTVKTTTKKILTVKEIAKKNNGVVLITTYNKNKEKIAIGSGFIISQSGKLLTNYHVIDNAFSVTVTTSNKKVYNISSVLGYSVTLDIAILQINSKVKFSYLTLGDSSKVELGESIVAIGSPLGLQNTVSTGIVSNINSGMFRENINNMDIQISAPISHGSSGGALFNMYGEVIGITYAGLAEAGGENLNFAIPINDYKKIDTKTPLSLQKVYEKEHIKYYDVGKYEGELSNGEPNGLGVFTWNDGDVYVGYHKNGVINGQGKIWLNNGNTMEGEWLNSKLNGKGIFTWADGSTYEGDFVDSNFEGYGTLIDTVLETTYTGNFKNNFKNGIGTVTDKDGFAVTGIWKDGRIADGDIIITYEDGSTKTGKILNGQIASIGNTNFTGSTFTSTTTTASETDSELPDFKEVLKEKYKSNSTFLTLLEEVELPEITKTSQRHRDAWISAYENSVAGASIPGMTTNSISEQIAINSANSYVLNMN